MAIRIQPGRHEAFTRHSPSRRGPHDFHGQPEASTGGRQVRSRSCPHLGGSTNAMSDRNDGNGRALQRDRNLDGWKTGAGVATVVALLALTGTSLVRAPNDVWTIILPVLAAVVLLLVVRGLVVRRRRSSR